MMNDSLQYHTIESSNRFKCITMWRIIHQTGCTKTDAFKRMNIDEYPHLHCYACKEDRDTVGHACHDCPITWPTKDGRCIALHDKFLYARTPEDRIIAAEPILDACASWIPDPTDEVFLPITGYKDLYEVSNFGRVRSIERYCRGKSSYRRVPECILTHGLDHEGYPVVRLSKDGISKSCKVNGLVWESHIETSQGHDESSKTYSRICYREGKSPALYNLYRIVESAHTTS